MKTQFNFVLAGKYLCAALLGFGMAVSLSLILVPHAAAQQRPAAPAAPNIPEARPSPVAAATTGEGAPQSPVENSATAASATPRASEERYRIGLGDLLDIRVFNQPQFSRDAVRVDGRGMIRMPLIEGEIQAACRTENELAMEITKRYLEYVRNPQVDVFVKEYQSQPVAVIGAVRAPGRFQLQRRVRLLELLTFVGGPSETAGRSIQVIHTGAPSVACEAPSPAANISGETAALDSYLLSDALQGDEKSNPYVRPGDIVSLPEAEQAFIVGNVLKPSVIVLKEPITVTRAIAMAGGLMPDTKTDRIRIVRQRPGETAKQEIFIDLRAIEKRRAEDIVLQAGDIVDVPTSSGRRLLRSLVGAVVPAIGQLPVRVIP